MFSKIGHCAAPYMTDAEEAVACSHLVILGDRGARLKFVSAGQKLDRTRQPALKDVLMRREAGRSMERAGEVKGAHPCFGRQAAYVERLLQLRLDLLANASEASGRQTADGVSVPALRAAAMLFEQSTADGAQDVPVLVGSSGEAE